MKKYTPSVKNNNQVKDELMQEMKAFLYRIEKGKYGKNLDKDTVKEVYDSLANAADGLSGIIFTGDEDLTMVNDKIGSCLTNVKKALEQDYSNRLVEASDDLLYYLDSFKAIADGEIDYIDEEEIKAKKLSWSKRRLYARLDELKEIKTTFEQQEKRLINDLYRKISALKSKLDMLNVRRSNYSACFNILDIIYANASEILTASQFSMEEASKAKVLLNIGKLKAVVNEPDKAIAILKVMDKDIKAISEKVKSMDEKVFGLDTKQTSVTDSALAYKEELMRKKREKEFNGENLDELERGKAASTKKVGEDK